MSRRMMLDGAVLFEKITETTAPNSEFGEMPASE